MPSSDAMRPSRSTAAVVLVLVLVVGAFAATTGCEDADPRYGPPGAIRGRTIEFGDAAPPPLVEAGPTTKSAPDLFAELYATLTDATEAKGSKCIPCHAAAQMPVFIKATAEETRTTFKMLKYQDIVNGRFFNKGQHAGNALKEPQQLLAQQWAQKESP